MSSVLAAAVLVMVGGAAARDGYRNNESDVLSTLGQFAAKRRARHIALDARDRTHVYRRLAFLGSTVEQGKNPWSQGDKARTFDAWLEFSLVPNELVPRKGVKLSRAGGAYLAVGSMREPPFAKTPEALLEAGRTLTFEAEYMASDRMDTLARAAGASGGRARSVSPRHREPVPKFYLASGTTVPLPAGTYDVDFYFDAQCGGFAHERVGAMRLSIQGRMVERPIECDRLPPRVGAFRKLSVRTHLSSSTPVEVATRYDQGSLTLDRVTFRRQPSTRPAAVSPRPAAASPRPTAPSSRPTPPARRTRTPGTK
jgi:hypothetical protein